MIYLAHFVRPNFSPSAKTSDIPETLGDILHGTLLYDNNKPEIFKKAGILNTNIKIWKQHI